MKHQWLAYGVVGLLSIGAGVAIAGLPNNVPVDATIIPPTTTEATASTVPETTVPETTVPDTTMPETTVPETTPSTSEPTTTESVPVELAVRSASIVAAANGANVAGAASTMATRLQGLGYIDVVRLDGTTIFDFTTVFFADGFELEAQRLADDLELLPEFVEPIADAPSVAELPANTQLLVYIGRDRT